MQLKPGQPIKTTGRNLAGLWRPSFVKIDQRLYVFGGGGNVTDDLHFLDLHTMRWEIIQVFSGTPPCKRYGHSATRWKDTIIVFGGCNEFQDYCNDVHIFDLKTNSWHQPTITGTISPRYLHSATVFDDKLIIYGGFAKSSDCTYVLDELCVLDLHTMIWQRYHDMPPRYNHSATLINNRMYIYAGKDEQGNTVSDLFMIHLNKLPYVPHLVLSGQQQACNNRMVLLKSQHFCDTACGKLLVFGRYLNKSQQESTYSLWMLDLDTLEWEKQECDGHFDMGGWNYFTIMTEREKQEDHPQQQQQQQQLIHQQQDIILQKNQQQQDDVAIHHLLFLGNIDPYRPQGYDHFRDALVVHGESLGLYDIAEPHFSTEFIQLLNRPELSDFTIIASNGVSIHVHQVILLTRWPHFKKIIQNNDQKELVLSEPFDVIMTFLRFLYSDRLDPTASWPVVCDVLVMAYRYSLHRLKKLCCQRLFQCHMAIDSCGMIFEKAILADEIGLKLLALRFMFQHYGSLLKSNRLLCLPTPIRDAFLEAVPEEAVLEVGRSNTKLNDQQQPSSLFTAFQQQQQQQGQNELIPIDNHSDMTVEV